MQQANSQVWKCVELKPETTMLHI